MPPKKKNDNKGKQPSKKELMARAKAENDFLDGIVAQQTEQLINGGCVSQSQNDIQNELRDLFNSSEVQSIVTAQTEYNNTLNGTNEEKMNATIKLIPQMEDAEKYKKQISILRTSIRPCITFTKIQKKDYKMLDYAYKNYSDTLEFTRLHMDQETLDTFDQGFVKKTEIASLGVIVQKHEEIMPLKPQSFNS